MKKTQKAAEEAARRASGKVGFVRIVGEEVPFRKTKEQLDAVRSGTSIVIKDKIFPVQIGLPEMVMR